jgi:hypothetical protein
MQIELEVLAEDERSDHPSPCWVCDRTFVIGAVAAWAYSDTPVDDQDNRLDCGPVCPMCLEEGPQAMYRRLKDKLQRSLAELASDDYVAQDDALLFSEGVPDMPTLEELREMERRFSLGSLDKPTLHIVGD